MILFIIVTNAPDTLSTGTTIAMNIFDRRVIPSLQARINVLHTIRPLQCLKMEMHRIT